MSTILCIYSEEPRFPATDQHPDAVRYEIGGRWVDALDGAPSSADIDAMLNPPGDEGAALIKRQADDLIANGHTVEALLLLYQNGALTK